MKQVQEDVDEQIVAQYEKQALVEVLTEQEAQQMFAQIESKKYATIVDVSPSTQFVTTTATTSTSQDEEDDGHTYHYKCTTTDATITNFAN